MPSQIMWQEAVQRTINDASAARADLAKLRAMFESDVIERIDAAEKELDDLIDYLDSADVMDASPDQWESIQADAHSSFMHGEVGNAARGVAETIERAGRSGAYEIAFYPVRDRIREMARCIDD